MDPLPWAPMLSRLFKQVQPLTLALIWLPTVVIALSVGVGLLGRGGLAITLAGGASLLASWAYLSFGQRRRSEASREIRKGLRAAWDAIDKRPPRINKEDASSVQEDWEPGDPALKWVSELAPAAREALNERGLEIENLRAVLDAVESAVLVTDVNGALIRANVAGMRFFQNRTRLLGATIEELFTQAEVLNLHAAATAGRNGSSQIRIPRPEGVRICQVMAYRVAWSTIQGPSTAVVMVVRDVTELAMAAQLKTDFVANASHELRTPLSSIRGAVETIRDGAKDEPAMLDRLTQMIAQNVTRLEELVRDMLDLSRLETPDAPVSIEPVDVAGLAEQLAEQFAQVCEERDIRIEHEVAPDAAVVRSDPRLLQLVLKNLVDNATKFAYPGTAIRITAERATNLGRAAVRLRVADQGMGIPIGQQQRIFERFYQVDASRSGVATRRGTGLGLAIVKHAVKNLGGTIRVESVWKQGTTMIVELPNAIVDEGDTNADD